MRKIIILVFAIVLIIATHDHYTKKENKQINKNDSPTISNRIEKEETPEINEKPSETNEESSDEQIITYVSNVKKEVEAIQEKEIMLTFTIAVSFEIKAGNVIKEKFIILTDFLFYNGEINGITFDELTTEAKIQIINMYEEIDLLIEIKIPGYKEKLDKTYQNIKEDLKVLKNKIKDKYIDEIGEENYKEQQQLLEESIDNLEESIKPTIDAITEQTIQAYEKTKQELDNWYQNWKEDVAR